MTIAKVVSFEFVRTETPRFPQDSLDSAEQAKLTKTAITNPRLILEKPALQS
jgi:hypothetical protein